MHAKTCIASLLLSSGAFNAFDIWMQRDLRHIFVLICVLLYILAVKSPRSVWLESLLDNA